ncbi:MAG: biotin--[acetyl-CoA-carboxylase] ligase [Proteobacteria bacterium]|nr:biotin--[acetyl-CoA-carboxylase] ligase [Pseudomonadota bacterium]
MKSKLLKILSQNIGLVCSGESLSSELGVSRVSIWKHIKKLRELGYRISSTAKGYILESVPDALYPWEFPERQSTIHYFAEVASTMDSAKSMAREGCPHFTVVVAERQNKGRGRLRRTWYSEKGGLYFTIVLRPKIPPALMSRISFAASLSLSGMLQSMFQVNARVKWPNDILVDDRKISGMLCEMEVEDDMVSFLNIGIGLNVNNDPSLLEPNSISLKQLLGRDIPRRVILSGFLDAFEGELDGGTLDHIVPEWKKQTITLNRQVKVVTTQEVVEGKAVDVDDNGALLIEQSDRSIRKVFYGDCFHQSP